MRFPGASAVVLAVAVSIGCTSDPDTTGNADYRDPGPYAAGVTTLMLGDREVEVWYPAAPEDTEGVDNEVYFIRDWLSAVADAVLPEDLSPPFETRSFRGVPASQDGPFPLVVFAHGALSYRNQSTFLTEHFATWGFVVASIDYLERGLSSFPVSTLEIEIDDRVLTEMVVELMAAENQTASGLLEGVVSTDRIAITGHSAGGGTTVRFADDPRVVTYMPMSAGFSSSSEIELPAKPSLWLTGDIDAIVELGRVESAFEQAPSPARLVVIEDMGHLGPSDICAIGASGGGVIGLAIEGGLDLPENVIRLGTDGCQDEAVSPQAGWIPIRHFMTAHLRDAFGIDPQPVGLSQEVEEELPEVTFSYREKVE